MKGMMGTMDTGGQLTIFGTLVLFCFKMAYFYTLGLFC